MPFFKAAYLKTIVHVFFAFAYTTSENLSAFPQNRGMAPVPAPYSDAADPTGDEPTIAYLPDKLGDGSTACASCRHQRRRCEPTCPLAPYFPATMAPEFEEVRRLHGVRKLVRFVRSVPESDRRVLVTNLIHHALARRADPVMGLVGEVARLQAAILAAKHERDLLHRQLLHLHGNDHFPTPPPATSSALRWSPTIFHLVSCRHLLLLPLCPFCDCSDWDVVF